MGCGNRRSWGADGRGGHCAAPGRAYREVGIVGRAIIAVLAVVAVYAVVSLALGESAKKPTIEGAGDFLQSDPAPSLKDSFTVSEPLKETLRTFQPPALFPDAGGSQWGAGPPVYTEDHVGLVRRTESQAHDEQGPEQVAETVRVRSSCDSLRAGEWRGVDVWVRVVCTEVDSDGTTVAQAFHDPIAFDPLWAYVTDIAFDPYTPRPAPSPSAPVQSAGGALSEGELRAVLTEAGWPEHLHGEALRIIRCESRGRPDAVGDGGNSLGMFQLWYGWFSKAGYSSDQYADPVVNASVARYVYETRGRWGGGGGWSCADHLSIHPNAFR